ncbi:hypothetical protein FACS1894208_03980 [Clostridia bacterium]|nr:hypothetical protein FACS1894208_03980 [Clostridia bacterium]
MQITVIGEERIFINDQAKTIEYAVVFGALRNYGIRVRMGNECAILQDLTTRREEILAFAKTLRQSRVTPTTLKYIAEDALPLSQLIDNCQLSIVN